MKRGLQIFLAILGAVMVVAGLQTVLTGAALVLEGGEVSASVDSEMHFYGAWYLVVGALLFRALPQLESATTIVRVVGVGFFIAACGRLISLVQAGRPHTLYVVLMVVEFVIPLVVIPAQAKLVRAGQ